MANTPNIPLDYNIDNGKEYRSIQEDISNYVKQQKDLGKELAKQSESTQAKLVAGLHAQQEYINELQGGEKKLNTAIQERIKLKVGTEADAKDVEIRAIQQEIKFNKFRMDGTVARMKMELQAATEEEAKSNRWINIVKKGLQDITGLDVKEFNLAKKIGDEISEQGIESKALAYSIGAIVMMLKGAFDLFKKMDAAAWEFRKAMGMTRTESAFIRKDAENLAINYMAMGVTIDQIYKSYQAIGQAVGGVHNVSKDMARDVSLMAAQLGISEEASVGFMRNLAVVSQSTMESQQNMMGLAQSMSSAAGVNLGEVMQDVSKASSTSLTLMSRMPNTVLRTAIELRHMGISMDAAANAGAHILDFTQSMNEEMDASVLLGKNISFQKARELTYARDLEGAAKETLKLAQQNGFAHKMDYLQQQAFAKASGYTVEQLMSMVQTSEQIAQIKRGTNVQAKAELAAYEKMRKENDATLKARGKDAMYQIRTLANQQRMAQLQNKWNELLAKAQQFLLPIIDKLLSGALILIDWSTYIMIATGRVLKFLGPLIEAAGFCGKILLFFGKWLEPIGWVIMAFQAISGFFTGWSNTSGNWLKKLGGGLLGILEGIIPGFSYVEKLIGWIWGGISKAGSFLFGWMHPIQWISTAFHSFIGLFAGMHGSAIGFFGSIWGFIKRIGSAVVSVGIFLFKWFTPVGLIFQAFKGLRKLMPETFAAIGGLFNKIWSVALNVGKFLFMWATPIGWLITGIKKLVQIVSSLIAPVVKFLGTLWSIYKKIWGTVFDISKAIVKWLFPIKMVWTWIKSVGTAIKEAFSAGWGMVKSFFGVIGSSFQYIKTTFTRMLTGWAHVLDHFLASIINGLSSIGSRIMNALTKPFSDAWNRIKSWWGGKSPSKLGMAIVQGLKSVGYLIYSALTSPFTMALGWIRKHIPFASILLGKGDASKLVRKPVESRAQAAYVPAVTVSPSGTKIKASSASKPSKAKEKEKSSATLDDILDALTTQNKLLEKLLAKDTRLSIDSSELSTRVSRGIAFKGNYGVNK